jgi:hypothetical protein
MANPMSKVNRSMKSWSARLIVGVLALTPAPARAAVQNMLIVYGQSMALGAAGCPAISTTQPYSNRMLSQDQTSLVPLIEVGTCSYGPQTAWDSSAAYQVRALVSYGGNSYTALVTNTNVVPDRHPETWQPAPLQESPGSSVANNVTLLDPTHTFTMIVNNFAVSGAAIADLQRGSGPYTRLITGVTSAQSLLASGDSLVVVGVYFVEGDSDLVYASTTYKNDNLVLRASLDADVKAITGQTQDIRFFFPQISSMMSTSTTANTTVCPDQTLACIDDPAGSAAPQVALSQWQLQRDYPQWFYLTGPCYQYTYSDGGFHPDNVSYNLMGATAARVLKSVLVDQNANAIAAVFPADISRDGAVITVRTRTPNALPLAIDTSTVSNPYYNGSYDVTGKGFQFFSTGGNSDTMSISSVTVSGTTITITLNQIPTGTNQRVAYAFEGDEYANTPQFHCGPDDMTCNGQPVVVPSRGTVHGNIRTVADYTDVNGDAVYHWLVHFNEPVGFHWTRPGDVEP